MSKKYREQLNRIVMTEDMKKRILHNVLKEDMKVKTAEIKKNSVFMRNVKIIVACFTVILCLNIVNGNQQLFKYNNLSQKSIDDANKEAQNIKASRLYDNNNKVSGLYDNNRDIQNNNELIEQEIKNQYTSQDEEYRESDSSEANENNNINNINGEKRKSNENSSDNQNNNSESDNRNVKNHNSDKTNSNSNEKNSEKNNNGKEEIEKPPILTTGQGKKEYKTLEEAEEAAKLKIDYIKEISSEVVINKISVIASYMIEIEYNNGQNIIIFRAGKVADNISGDYNTYKVQQEYEINGVIVKLQGNKDKVINLATWKKNDISYSISSENGIAEEVILNMINSSVYSE